MNCYQYFKGEESVVCNRAYCVPKEFCVLCEWTRNLVVINLERLQLNWFFFRILQCFLWAFLSEKSPREYSLDSIVILWYLRWVQKSKFSYFIQPEYAVYPGRTEGGCKNNMVLAGKRAAGMMFQHEHTKTIRKVRRISLIFTKPHRLSFFGD